LPQVVFQTPIPTQGSEEIVVVAVIVWFFIILLLSRRLGKVLKHFGDIVSFLLYFLGVLFLAILIL
jgi:hypothetical protein